VTSSSPSPSPTEQANVEVVRQGIEAFNRGDFDAMLQLGNAEDFEYDWSRSRGPNSGIYRGVEGLREFISDQWSTFEKMTLEAHEYIPRGNHVIVTTTTHGRGRGGIAVSANSAQLYTFENGRLVRITLYQKREEALAAAD
jgi:ketosteroid isomerase-like protein